MQDFSIKSSGITSMAMQKGDDVVKQDSDILVDVETAQDPNLVATTMK